RLVLAPEEHDPAPRRVRGDAGPCARREPRSLETPPSRFRPLPGVSEHRRAFTETAEQHERAAHWVKRVHGLVAARRPDPAARRRNEALRDRRTAERRDHEPGGCQDRRTLPTAHFLAGPRDLNGDPSRLRSGSRWP